MHSFQFTPFSANLLVVVLVVVGVVFVLVGMVIAIIRVAIINGELKYLNAGFG